MGASLHSLGSKGSQKAIWRKHALLWVPTIKRASHALPAAPFPGMGPGKERRGHFFFAPNSSSRSTPGIIPIPACQLPHESPLTVQAPAGSLRSSATLCAPCVLELTSPKVTKLANVKKMYKSLVVAAEEGENFCISQFSESHFKKKHLFNHLPPSRASCIRAWN